MATTIQIRRGNLASLPSLAAGEPAMTLDQIRHYLGSAGGNRLVGLLDAIDQTTAPTVNDDAGDGFSVGSVWTDTTNDKSYICSDSTIGAAVWQQFSGTGAGGGGTVTSIDASRGARTSTGAALTTSGSIYGAQQVNAQTGTTYAIQDSDRGNLITHAQAASVATSIAQAGAAGNFLADWYTTYSNLGPGVVTITPTTSLIGGKTDYTVYPGRKVRITSDATNYLVSDDETLMGAVSNKPLQNQAIPDNSVCLVIGDMIVPAGVTVGLGAGASLLNVPTKFFVDSSLTAIATFPYRLSLTSGNASPSADVTGAGTLYLTPLANNGTLTTAAGSGWLFNGTIWVPFTSAQVSLALTLTSGKNYDVFAYVSATGILTLVLSAAWTTDTARADALGLQDGVVVNGVAYGACAAGMGRWLGTIRASGTNTTESSLTKQFVSNSYNPINLKLEKRSATASWTCSSTSYQQWNSDSTQQVEMVVCSPGRVVQCGILGFASGSNVSYFAIGNDSTTAPLSFKNPVVGNVNGGTCYVPGNDIPTAGYHKYCCLERVNTPSNVHYGVSGGDQACGLWATVGG